MEVTKFRSQLFIALEQVTVHLRQAQNTLTGVGRSVAAQPRRLVAIVATNEKITRHLSTVFGQAAILLRQTLNGFTRLGAIFLDAIAVTNAEVARQLSIAWGQVTVPLQHAQNTLIELVRSVADKPRRLQEEVRARQSELRRLLASSFDAVVVTDAERRLVAANPMASHLFGVSEANMRKFSIDAFLSRRQIPYFGANGSPFIGRKTRQGECKIRCLD